MASPDHGLVLATYALQLGLISRDQLSQALQFWLQDTSRPIAQVLVDHRYLSEEDRQTLHGLAERHLRQGNALVEDSIRRLQGQSGQTPEESPDSQPDTRDIARSIMRTLREDAGTQGGRRVPLTVLNVSHERFRILRPYAMGGLGIVSVAHDIELDREVAIKEMLPGSDSSAEEMQRFLLEARVTGQLDHPGIPPVYALGYFEDGRPFYVMRLIEGKTLRDEIKEFHRRYPHPDRSRERVLELRQLLGSIVSVCNTLRFAHERGILHRDIKPSNIMLGDYGETIVLDWGLATSRQQGQPLSIIEHSGELGRRRTNEELDSGTGSVVGTPHYMSPEQANGELELINVRSDVYSVGATLYHLLTGKAPFSGLGREEILDRVKLGQLSNPTSLDNRIARELEAICLKAMAPERSERFANTGELASELEHWLADEPVACYREPTTKRLGRWLKTHRVMVASLMALMATGLVALVIGAFIVAMEHENAVQQEQRADEIADNAKKEAAESRELITNWLVIGYNSRVENLEGTEFVRLAFLNRAIELLQRRATESAYDVNGTVDWALAVAERARVHHALKNSQAAWQDFVQSFAILSDLKEIDERGNGGYVLSNRVLLLIEMANFLLTTDRGSRRSREFITRALHEAKFRYDQHPTIPSAQFAYVQARLLEAQSLQESEPMRAFESLSEAITIVSRLLGTQPDVDNEIFNGSRELELTACQCTAMLAQIAMRLELPDHCRVNAIKAESQATSLIAKYPELARVSFIKLEMRWLLARLRIAVSHNSRQALNDLRVLLKEGEATHAPANLINGVALDLAAQELQFGRLEYASRYATAVLADSVIDYELELRAHHIMAKCFQLQGDAMSAEMHTSKAVALQLENDAKSICVTD